MIDLSIHVPDLTDEEKSVLQGDTPFDTIVDNLAAQFTDFQDNVSVRDTTDYITLFYDEYAKTKRIHQQAFEEYELDDGVLRKMLESISDIFLYCMEEIGCDPYQLDDPMGIAHHIYTNFILTDQRQVFFEYAMGRIIDHIDPSSTLFASYERMYHGDPRPMYELLSDLDLSQDDNITEYLFASGNDVIGEQVRDGFIPENVMMDLFLKPFSLSQAYSTYYMHRLQTKSE